MYRTCRERETVTGKSATSFLHKHQTFASQIACLADYGQARCYISIQYHVKDVARFYSLLFSWHQVSVTSLVDMRVSLTFGSSHHSFPTVLALDIPQSQYAALFDLYNATNGENWNWVEPYSQFGFPWDFGPSANPCNDSWQGIFCAPIPGVDNYKDVVVLYHSDYSLEGQLPDSIGNFPQLRQLVMSQSSLSGSIPGTINKLTNLRQIELSRNHLQGTLPRDIGRLSKLQQADFYGNNLNGSLPWSIGNMTDLTELNVGYNSFTGPLPNSLTNLTKLSTLTLERNHFEGPLPEDLGKLNLLTQLEIYLNHFTGPIPHSICNLTGLVYIGTQFNHFSSSIPSCIGDLTMLAFMGLEFNRLTGAIPESVTKLYNLVTLQLDNNLLTHTIPNAIGSMRGLIDVNLFHNRLVGTIPDSIWTIERLQNLYLNSNHLTGPFVASFNASAAGFQHINVSENHMHGTIPESVGVLRGLYVFSAAGNLLTGTIPASFSQIPLEVLQIGNNAFTGTIPSSFLQLTDLIVLSVKGNQLTGSLDQVFSPAQVNLITVQLDDNQFKGEIPSVLFDLPSLISLSIVGSCMHGTLPSNICNAVNLEAIVLYGLTTGASCRAVGVQALSIYREQFGGSFPECVLSLPKLRTLLLASNRLSGQISSSAVLRESLLQLDLSHNLLTGSIPFSIQNHSWGLLDLSHNKLNGVLGTEFFQPLNVSFQRQINSDYLLDLNFTLPSLTAHSVLTLNTNRLSGRVPNHVKPVRDLSMLAGNLFDCRYDKSDLPQYDSDISNYECASNSFNLSIYLWLALAIALPLTLWAAARYYDVWTHIQTWFLVTLPDGYESKTNKLLNVLNVCHGLISVSLYCAAFCMLVLLPYYAIVSQYEGTHTHQYAYVLSAIYTSGVIPFALDMVLLAALLAVFALRCRPLSATHEDDTLHALVPMSTRGKVFVSFVLLNVTAVFGVNVAFVYTVLYQSTTIQTAAQVLLSLFKLGWSTAVSPWMIRQLDNYFIPANEGPAEPFFTLQLLVSLFNNIAIPCLVVMAVDPNCFSEVLSPPSSTTVAFLLPVCVENLQKGVVCEQIYYQRSSLSFSPPFQYSYQCSASFITSYAPTFVYMSIATVFINPLVRQGIQRLHARVSPSTCFHEVLSALLPRILQPPPTEPTLPGNKRERPLFRAVGILVTLLMQLGVLLTFGAIFPPVALAMAVSIVATVYTARWELQRFIQSADERGVLYCLVTINDNCAKVGTCVQMYRAVKIIVCYCSAFYTLFLFDTLGDEKGFRATLWVLFILPFAPLLFGYAPQLCFARKDASDRCDNIQEKKLKSRDSSTTTVETGDFIQSDTVNKMHEI